MENFCIRFPIASKNILNNLDVESLARSKEVSQNIFRFIEMKMYWMTLSTTNMTFITLNIFHANAPVH